MTAGLKCLITGQHDTSCPLIEFERTEKLGGYQHLSLAMANPDSSLCFLLFNTPYFVRVHLHGAHMKELLPSYINRKRFNCRILPEHKLNSS